MPHRSDYDPYAFDPEDDYDPFAESGQRRPRRPDPGVIAFFERAQRYGTPVQLSNGGTAYWMDREAEEADRRAREAAPVDAGRHGAGMTIAEAVEKLSGRVLQTVPTPGRRLQTRADCGPHRPAEWTWVPPDPTRPILAPGERGRAFIEVMRGCSSGIVELKYRHPDDPFQLRRAEIAGLSAGNLDPLKSELVFGDTRFPAVLVLMQEQGENWWSIEQVGAWIGRSQPEAMARAIYAALEAACATGDIAARGKRRIYINDRALPMSHLTPEFLWYSEQNSKLQPWPESIRSQEWPDLTFFARLGATAGEQYRDAIERALDELATPVELRSKSLNRLAWADVEFSADDVMAKWSEAERLPEADPAQAIPDSPSGAITGSEKVLPRRRGPKPGTLDRYRDSDRALYPELERLMHDEHLSRTAAAMALAAADRVAGVGSAESRAKRLARRYEQDRSEQN